MRTLLNSSRGKFLIPIDSFTQILNDAVRSALKPKSRELPKLLTPASIGIMPEIDPVQLSDLADELEAETYISMAKKKTLQWLSRCQRTFKPECFCTLMRFTCWK